MPRWYKCINALVNYVFMICQRTFMTYKPYLLNMLHTYTVCVHTWGTECVQTVPSPSTVLQHIFESGPPQCCGFETI